MRISRLLCALLIGATALPAYADFPQPVIRVCNPGEGLAVNWQHPGEFRLLCLQHDGGHRIGLVIESSCGQFHIAQRHRENDGWYRITCFGPPVLNQGGEE